MLLFHTYVIHFIRRKHVLWCVSTYTIGLAHVDDGRYLNDMTLVEQTAVRPHTSLSKQGAESWPFILKWDMQRLKNGKLSKTAAGVNKPRLGYH